MFLARKTGRNYKKKGSGFRCGDHGKMNAHHIKAAKDFPELRYDVHNGICLCVECHKQIHFPTRSDQC